MPIWALVHRELRTEARRPGHHWLRTGAAAALVLAWGAWMFQARTQATGQGLFQLLSKSGLAGVWLLAPLLTADCLAREKREGTIGLLFLTPLRPLDVVWAKAFLLSWRAFVLMAATWPVLAVPILMGGVGFPQVVRMLLLQAGALGLALAAGVAASALASRWWRARLLAVGFTVVASVVFIALHVFLLTAWHWIGSRQSAGHVDFITDYGRRLVLWWQWQWWGLRFSLAGFPGGGSSGWPGVVEAAAVALGSGILVWGTGRLAAHGLGRTWRPRPDAGPSGQGIRLLTRSLAGVRWTRWWREFWLRWAPLVWIERQRWSGRLGVWLWLAWVAVPLSVQVSEEPRSDFVTEWGWLWAWVLLLGMMAASVGRLQGRVGVAEWELLVVTPQRRGALMAGLAGSVLISFGPALVVLTGTQLLAAWGGEGDPLAPWEHLGQALEYWLAAGAFVACGIGSAVRGCGFLRGLLGVFGWVGMGGQVLKAIVMLMFQGSIGFDPNAPFGPSQFTVEAIWSGAWVRAIYWGLLAVWAWNQTLRRLGTGDPTLLTEELADGEVG